MEKTLSFVDTGDPQMIIHVCSSVFGSYQLLWENLAQLQIAPLYYLAHRKLCLFIDEQVVYTSVENSCLEWMKTMLLEWTDTVKLQLDS